MADRPRLVSIVAVSAAATAFLAPLIADAFFGGLGFLGIVGADGAANCDAACAIGAAGAAAAAAAAAGAGGAAAAAAGAAGSRNPQGDPEPIPPGGDTSDANYQYEYGKWKEREYRRRETEKYLSGPRGVALPAPTATPVPLSKIYQRNR